MLLRSSASSCLLSSLVATALGFGCASSPIRVQAAPVEVAAAPRFLNDAQEVEFVELVRRAQEKDEAGKSEAQDEGRMRFLLAALVGDLYPKKEQDAATCRIAQREAEAALRFIRTTQERFRAKAARRGTFAELRIAAYTSRTARHYDVIEVHLTPPSGKVLDKNSRIGAASKAPSAVARAVGRPTSVAVGDVWTLFDDDTIVNAPVGCAPPPTAEIERERDRTALARVYDILDRRAPDVAARFRRDKRDAACRVVQERLRVRLKMIHVEQEMFHARHRRYALWSELSPEALPRAEEEEAYRFDLVTAEVDHFLVRATGRGATPLSGDLWELDEYGVPRAVFNVCADDDNRTPEREQP